jgi:energy-coupling factor transporter ATP-binding protein EcfA2
MIEARGLTKRYGDKTAVDNLSFTVRPGAVTGFLGPNGAGKSTTIRMILGLDAPSAGSVTVNGRPYSAHAAPLREVGALLEAKAVHKGRSARDHLLALAATTGISRRRVDEVIAITGLTEVAGKRAGGFSRDSAVRAERSHRLAGRGVHGTDRRQRGLPRRRQGRQGGTRMITNLLAAEWTKVRSLRSSYWVPAGALAVVVVVGAMLCHAFGVDWNKFPAAERAGFDPVMTSFRGIELGQLAIGTLGVLVFTAEQASGTIRATFAAIPRRRWVFAAKAVVLGALALVIGELIAFSAFLMGQAMLRPAHIGVSLGRRNVLGEVAAAGLYLAVIGLIGLALGTLLRHTAGAMVALFGLVFLLAPIVRALPQPWDTRIGPYLLSNAGAQLMALHPDPNLLPPDRSLLVVAGYLAAFLAAAGWLINHRDA